MDKKYEVKTIKYNNERAMTQGKKNMISKGWEVVETVTINGRYGCFNTACLGCLFLPLALLGKSSDSYQVTYRKVK